MTVITSSIVLNLSPIAATTEDTVQQAKNSVELAPLLSATTATTIENAGSQHSPQSIYETVNELNSQSGDRSPPNQLMPEIKSPPVPDNSGSLRKNGRQMNGELSGEPWWDSDGYVVRTAGAGGGASLWKRRENMNIAQGGTDDDEINLLPPSRENRPLISAIPPRDV